MENYSKYFSEVKREGYSIAERKYSKEFCSNVIDFMNDYSAEDAELQYQGTELRVWDAHLKSPYIMEFKQYADALVSEMYNKKVVSYTILALKNQPIPTDGSQRLGRWHIDSFREQVKVFTFLSDVEDENGPFEFLKGTHTPGFKFRSIFQFVIVCFFKHWLTKFIKKYHFLIVCYRRVYIS